MKSIDFWLKNPSTISLQNLEKIWGGECKETCQNDKESADYINECGGLESGDCPVTGVEGSYYNQIKLK